MTGQELQKRLVAAERSARWLAEKLGRSHTQVGRWLSDEQPIPAERAREIRTLLVTVPAVAEVRLGAIVKARKDVRGAATGRRYKVVALRSRTISLSCSECATRFGLGDVVARDIYGFDRALCLSHVEPIAKNEEG